jgi:hypothetical protein
MRNFSNARRKRKMVTLTLSPQALDRLDELAAELATDGDCGGRSGAADAAILSATIDRVRCVRKVRK